MKSFCTDSFQFVDYTEMDESMSRRVLECRNLPEIRRWMVNDKVISYDDHKQFVMKLHHLDNTLYYSVLSGGGVFIASINLQFDNQTTAERGIYLHPDFWGHGLSKKICKELYTHFRDNKGLKTVKTKVKKNNVSSNALERSLGAAKIHDDDEYNYYSLDLN